MNETSTSKEAPVMNLIHSAEVNISLCNFLYREKIDHTSPNQVSLGRLIANNSFSEALLIVHSLLLGTDRRELNIKKILDNDDMKIVIAEYKRMNFQKIRHQIIAHKNELVKNQGSNASLLLREDLRLSLEKIVKAVKHIFCAQCNWSPNANYSLQILDSACTLKHEVEAPVML